MQNPAQYGRNGDTMMAHVTPGELVVPQEVLSQRPDVARGLGVAFRDVGADPTRYVVGSGSNSINPVTGEPEFFLDKILDIIRSPAGTAVTTKVISDLVRGETPSLKDVLISGVIGGGLGSLGGGMSLAQSFGLGGDQESIAPVTSQRTVVDDGLRSSGTISEQQPVSSGYNEGLLGIGSFLGANPERGIGRMLNSKIGEALAMGIGAQLLDSIFSNEEKSATERMLEDRDRSYAEIMSDPDRIRFAPRELNEGGPAYFPRRNGGIAPEEGSGTEDDVPAMLTAGEFVMTRDAVKGAGNGDLNMGIQRMYAAMDELEDMA